MGLFGHFLTPTDLIALRDHKYRSGSATNLDRFLDWAWWSRVYIYVPDTVAPNLLTFIGWLCALLSAALVFFHCPSFTELIPRWVALSCFALLFTFQTLDAIDGKHARRIGESTPLGQLFDHCCDAFTAIWVAWIIAGLTGFGVGKTTYSVIVLFQVQMFVYIWWELHLGYFKCNTGGLAGFATGVTEGQVVVMGLCLAAGLLGPEVFRVNAIDVLPSFVGDLLVLLHCADTKLSLCIWTPFFFNIFKMILSDVIECLHSMPSENRGMATVQLLSVLVHVSIQYVFFSFDWSEKHPAWTCVIVTAYTTTAAIRMHLCAVCHVGR
eukprot:GHVN01057767.1.p1 GENE.GHVN01057767.1~~GHVN01057767.1.p1  ORF type:complete len:324 (+),score=14.64 GHVN01057767.1:83-1054(+)